MNRAHGLFRLQEIDLVIDKSKARLDEVTDLLSDDQELNQAKESLERAEDKLNSTRSALQSAEGVVSSQQFKIEQTEKKLYSGSVQNTRELQDLQMESDSLKRYLETLENRLLDAMVAHEEAELEFEADITRVELIQQRRDHELEDLLKEQSHIKNDLIRLENNREAALASISPEDLAVYGNLRLKKGGYAVALLDGSNCNLCGLSVGSSIQQTIRSGSDLIQCKLCNRFLYAG